jgi:23S rRNA (uracil1939-C5)-methyltransferase
VTDLVPGGLVPLSIDKPAVGGRMIARHHGRVLLVLGAIPGERVTARIERVAKGVVYAVIDHVEAPSPARRDPGFDLSCGGSLYAHIAYPPQLEIKARVAADAFARLGQIVLPEPIDVAGSPHEHGYRMRARLHVRDGRIGFFREGTHDLCSPRATRQLLPESCDVLDLVSDQLKAAGAGTVREVELSENVDGSGRVVHLESTSPLQEPLLDRLKQLEHVTGVTSGGPFGRGIEMVAGTPYVVDMIRCAKRTVSLRRHVLAFFQGNRFLLQGLATHVAGLVPEAGTVVDLYAGTGLFALVAAATRGARVVAVEGDRVAAADLAVNAAQLDGGTIEPVHQSVEAFTSRSRTAPDVLVVDPPRTGMSRDALDGAVRMRAPRIVYVSCDVATSARDARRLLTAGYALRQVRGFDLFPNTPHVELVSLFEFAG